MHVDLYEKIWMGLAVLMIAAFLGSITYGAFAFASHPPSHVETIDPKLVRTDARFATPGVSTRPDGSVQVVVLAQMFSFQPAEIRVPAHVPVTFRLTSADVIHGFAIVGSNGNTMVVPGYVSQFTTEFARPGDYLIVCNEFCGLGHHVMSGKLIVTEEEAP
ncbi:MAG: cytochrome c oxidase subunit II [Gemmatimonadetes bacterium]|nr:cytochrome c oxidase subunit II [Gemmatimonadota bacterium]